jgi:hypothetical protein
VLVDPVPNGVAEGLRGPILQVFSDKKALFQASAEGGVADTINVETELGQSGFTRTTYFAWARRAVQ